MEREGEEFLDGLDLLEVVMLIVLTMGVVVMIVLTMVVVVMMMQRL